MQSEVHVLAGMNPDNRLLLISGPLPLESLEQRLEAPSRDGDPARIQERRKSAPPGFLSLIAPAVREFKCPANHVETWGLRQHRGKRPRQRYDHIHASIVGGALVQWLRSCEQSLDGRPDRIRAKDFEHAVLRRVTCEDVVVLLIPRLFSVRALS